MCDAFVKNSVIRYEEHKNPEVCKRDKLMSVEIILSANTLVENVKNQKLCGKYLKKSDSRVNQVSELKRTHTIVEWAREKKEQFLQNVRPPSLKKMITRNLKKEKRKTRIVIFSLFVAIN